MPGHAAQGVGRLVVHLPRTQMPRLNSVATARPGSTGPYVVAPSPSGPVTRSRTSTSSGAPPAASASRPAVIMPTSE
ncbi:hypothetical protein GCM10027612_53440 [Microbispora bryophytorum subsp. camponoti]